MGYLIGIDIGGTKIAAAVFDAHFKELAQFVQPTPIQYEALLATCQALVLRCDEVCRDRPPVGIGIPGAADHENGAVYHAANTPALIGQKLGHDLQLLLQRDVKVANDADCAALSEAVLGVGRGYRTVFGLIMGTGVGGGLISDGKLIAGAHGLTGEIGHLPLPYREAADGPMAPCSCGQQGCIDKTISGPGLARLNVAMSGQVGTASEIAARASEGDATAEKVLEQFFITVAKAFVTIIHCYDPDIITISGGLNQLPGLYDRVPKLLERYTIVKNLRVKIVSATHGAMSGLRGAALLMRQ